MSYCVKCGNKIEDGFSFCSKCGFKFGNNNEEQNPNKQLLIKIFLHTMNKK